MTALEFLEYAVGASCCAASSAMMLAAILGPSRRGKSVKEATKLSVSEVEQIKSDWHTKYGRE